ncbi:SLBB domain-containing protein [Spirochaeta dissipatitropha]
MRKSIFKSILILLVISLLGPLVLLANDSPDDNLSAEQQRRVTLATTDPEYPVTPGDLYRLRFMPGSQTASLDIVIQNDFTVELGVVGSFSGRGMLYGELRSEIRRRVNAAYPGSQPAVQIISTGIFTVPVTGEVDSAYRRESWGLTRLSSLISGRLSDQASIRDIEIISANGTSRRYDLFLARRFGEQNQDPLIRPGDRVIVHPLERQVSIQGNVQRPGSYQLLPAEGLDELVNLYGGGLLPLANPQEVRLSRRLDNETGRGDELYLDLSQESLESVSLEHMDSVYIDSIERLRPFVFVEGAIGSGVGADGRETRPESSNTIELQMRPNTRLSSVIRRVENQITDVSDLENAYIRRNGERLPVNLRRFLFQEGGLDDVIMQPGDAIVIPFKQRFITIGGAVNSPGRYPYIEDRDWEYYAMLAGGIDRDRNSFNNVQIRGIDGTRRSKSDPLQPEDSIFVRSDNPIHILIRTGQIVAPIASTAALIISLLNM